MTDSNPVELVITYHPPAVVCGAEDELGVKITLPHMESFSTHQRWELPRYLIGIIKSQQPTRVVFRVVGSDVENTLSDPTLRAIKSGALGAEDLGIYTRRQ